MAEVQFHVSAGVWCCFWLNLTHWGRDKMAALFQTTFSNAVSFNLHISWQLSCHDMSKIVTWLDHYNQSKINKFLVRLQLWAPKPFMKWVPEILLAWWHESVSSKDMVLIQCDKITVILTDRYQYWIYITVKFFNGCCSICQQVLKTNIHCSYNPDTK